MLDRDAPRIRADRLREFVRERKQDAEAERIAAVKQNRHEAALEATCEIGAYEEILAYVETRSGELDERISIQK